MCLHLRYLYAGLLRCLNGVVSTVGIVRVDSWYVDSWCRPVVWVT